MPNIHMKTIDKYKKDRQNFRKELWKMMKKDPALYTTLHSLYILSRYKEFFGAIQDYALTLPRDMCKEINEIVWNHMLCGNFDSLWANLNYIDPEFTKKYMNSIPECVAMADATALVIAYEREMRKSEKK